ncbi:MAG: ATP-binding protein [Solirubrobacterales bacterium]
MRPDARPSLRDGLERLESGRFVGRREEMAALADLFAEPAGGVAFVCGPAGVGKSALLQAVAERERGRRRLLRLRTGDARSLVEPARPDGDASPLVALEEFDRHPAAVAFLRKTLLESLPPGAVVLVESRRPPPPTLLAGGLGSAVRTISLEPLDPADSLELLAGHGLVGEPADAVGAWAAGWPAALVLAAAAGRPPAPAALVARLAGEELERVGSAELEVAALKRTVDVDSLAAAGVTDPPAALRRLGGLTVCERRPHGIELHPLLRRALREELRADSPDREREIRRRLADHLHLHSRSGETWQLVELAALIDDPTVRWGFGGGDDPDLRAGHPEPTELPRIERAVTARHGTAWWEWTRRWLTERPESAVVVRGRDGTLRAFCIATSLRRLPEWGREDPVIGRWVEHAEAAAPLGEAVLWREALALDGDDEERERALLNATATLRSGAVNPRWFYGPLDPANEREVRFSRAMGAEHLAELDFDLGRRRLECHRIDHGPGGVIGLARDIVYRELGIAPRRPPTADQVRTALQALRRGGDLSGSPLTSENLAPAEQRREARARLSSAADDAFGPGREDRLLRATLDLAYLDEDADPNTAPQRLNVSRATFYRRLALATELLAVTLATMS